MRPQLLIALMFIFTLSTGCSSRSEGTEKGDCTDKADNDGDGAFDCKDDGCAGSPDCEAGSQKQTETDKTVKDGKVKYTSLGEKCDFPDDGGDSYDAKCKSFGGYTPIVSGNDMPFEMDMSIKEGRPISWLSLKVPGGKTISFAKAMGKLGKKKKSVQITDGKIEWRYTRADGKRNPYALIFRSYIGKVKCNAEDGCTSNKSKKSRLLVARLDGKNTCIIGKTSSNDEAREIADNLSLPCK